MKKLLLFIIVTVSFISAQNNMRRMSADLNCSTCHSCENPTKSNPCLKECLRHEIITVHNSPSDGPENIILNFIKTKNDLFKPVNFSHKVHSEMAEMSGGCTTCHHYNPPGDILSCRECHENDRARKDISKPDLKGAYHQQCLNCHRELELNTECESCHAYNSQVSLKSKADAQKTFKPTGSHKSVTRPAVLTYKSSYQKGSVVTFHHKDHIDLFGLNCTQCHTSQNCGDCHTAKSLIEAKPVAVNKNSDHALCKDCHDVKGNSCNKCHAENVKPGFEHKRSTGFDVSRFHGDLRCTQCHTKGFKGLDPNCSSCHQGWTPETFRHGKTGLILDEIHVELDCENCHKEMNFRIKPDCSDCHDDKSFPEFLPGKKGTIK